MADNVPITAGSGTNIASDDIGGVQHQRVKLSLGADGTAVDAVAGAGAVGTGVQRVTLASDDPAVTNIGATNEPAAGTDTATSGLNGLVKRLLQKFTAFTGTFGATTALKSVLHDSSGAAINLATGTAGTPAGGVSSIQGFAYNPSVTITRPANITAYTAVDVVGGALDFTAAGPSGGGTVIITGAQLELDISAIPSGMTSFRLELYNVTPPSATADNGAWDLVSGDRASYLGYYELGSPVDRGSTCYVEADRNKQVVIPSGGHLFAYLVTAGGYTPAANSEVYKVTLHTVGV